MASVGCTQPTAPPAASPTSVVGRTPVVDQISDLAPVEARSTPTAVLPPAPVTTAVAEEETVPEERPTATPVALSSRSGRSAEATSLRAPGSAAPGAASADGASRGEAEAPAAAALPGAPSGVASAPAESARTEHVVAAGETLSAIGRQYGVDAATIAAANGLPEPDVIRPGQRLLVPYGSPPAAASQPVEPAPTREASPPLPAGLQPYQAAFLTRAIEPARRSQEATGVPASVTLAQAILESDWGRSRLATEAHNYFGIKATRREGTAGTVWMRTYEAGVGYVNAPFRAYRSMEESFVDHGTYFSEIPLYAQALQVRDNAREFAKAIHRAGYATDPAYSDKLIRFMEKLGLERYDR